MSTEMTRRPQSSQLLAWAPFAVAIALATASDAQSEQPPPPWRCDPGWTPFTARGPVECLTWRNESSLFRDAHNDCVSLGASLVAIHSQEKDDFVQDLMETANAESVWLGLVNKFDGFSSQSVEHYHWLRKDRQQEVSYKPLKFLLRSSHPGVCGVKLQKYQTEWQMRQCLNAPYGRGVLCEKPAKCVPGTFGDRCEKECHCHGPVCDVTGKCLYGCQPGWMGDTCHKPKQNADVRYICINAQAHHPYVSIVIDTKGVNYRNIHGLNAFGRQAPFCNDTAITVGKSNGFVHVKILLTNQTIKGIETGACAGKRLDPDNFEWPLVIQERPGILMANDQHLLVTCNFSHAETLRRQGDSDRYGPIASSPQRVQETREQVYLELADAYDGTVIVRNATAGTPVRLRIRFGLGPGSLIQGVMPYNCDVTSGDGSQKKRVLDAFGCPVSDLVSAFHKTSEPFMIQTDWFPFFGFDGTQEVRLQCSFHICYLPCNPGCDVSSTGRRRASRRRRSAHDEADDNDKAVRWIRYHMARSREGKPLPPPQPRPRRSTDHE